MGRKIDDFTSDELIADSLQVTNYLEQSRHCQLHVLHLGMEDWLQHYLERYMAASPQVQFQIFLFSRFYAGKLELFLEEVRRMTIA